MPGESDDRLDLLVIRRFKVSTRLFELVEAFEQFRADRDMVALHVSGLDYLLDQCVKLCLVFYFGLTVARSREHVLETVHPGEQDADYALVRNELFLAGHVKKSLEFMGELFELHQSKERRVSLNRVYGPEYGTYRIEVAGMLLQLNEEAVQCLEIIQGVIDEAGQQLRVYVKFGVTHCLPPWLSAFISLKAFNLTCQ